jgi:hypothetical protein
VKPRGEQHRRGTVAGADRTCRYRAQQRGFAGGVVIEGGRRSLAVLGGENSAGADAAAGEARRRSVALKRRGTRNMAVVATGHPWRADERAATVCLSVSQALGWLAAAALLRRAALKPTGTLFQ